MKIQQSLLVYTLHLPHWIKGIKKKKNRSCIKSLGQECAFSDFDGTIKQWHCLLQGLVKGAILCFKNLYFYFRHGESTSTASLLTSPASQKCKDLNKVSLLLQDLEDMYVFINKQGLIFCNFSFALSSSLLCLNPLNTVAFKKLQC